MLQRLLGNPLEKLGVFGIRQRITSIDEAKSTFMEPAGDQNLVLQRKVYPLALSAIAERRVVDLNARHETSTLPVGIIVGLKRCAKFSSVFSVADSLCEFETLLERGDCLRPLFQTD